LKINLIGVPIHYGCDLKGADLAPDIIRNKMAQNHYEHEFYDFGNLYIPKIETETKYYAHPKIKFFDSIVEVNKNLAHAVYCSLHANSFPLVIGGDHSIAVGSISGASKYCKNLAVIWVDAHSDIHTDLTTSSGNLHGMPLAAVIGEGSKELTNLYFKGKKVRAENVFIIGARSIDEGEALLIKKKNISVFSTDYIKKYGTSNIINEINLHLKKNNIDYVHFSFDIDCLDPSIVNGTGTPEPNGLSVEDAKSIIKKIFGTKLVKSMDLVEYNPLLDKNKQTLNIVLQIMQFALTQLH
jgi:arginase